jgi:hypothetical protein
VAQALGERLYETPEDLSAAEKINFSYVSRIPRLTLLAPDIVEVIFAGRQPAEMTLAALMEPFHVGWVEQNLNWGSAGAEDS